MHRRAPRRGGRGIEVNDPSDGAEVLEWTSHPARERPLATALLVLIILLAGMTAAVVMGNAWWGFLGVALLFLSLWTYFLPTRFRIDGEGVSKKSVFGTERKPWGEVRKVIPDRYGVLLSPFPQDTRLAKFRGLSVQFAGNGEEVLEAIRRHVVGAPDQRRG